MCAGFTPKFFQQHVRSRGCGGWLRARCNIVAAPNDAGVLRSLEEEGSPAVPPSPESQSCLRARVNKRPLSFCSNRERWLHCGRSLPTERTPTTTETTAAPTTAAPTATTARLRLPTLPTATTAATARYLRPLQAPLCMASTMAYNPNGTTSDPS
eukprot:scaffold55282_cov60-Phaeocystis_antarctica.AAC.1